ncbi:MAG: TatD family hydrolase [Sulfuriferula sp.]
MFVDSHCHLDLPDLAAREVEIVARMREYQVTHALCVSVNLERYPQVLAVAQRYPHIFASVGVHPDYENITEPDVAGLVALAAHPRVVAIGETGLDYFRLTGDLEWQRERFRTHIRAARNANKPLIIHTRAAAADTLRIMREEGADQVGGVMHCFTESQEVAEAALALNFYISLSGIVTFKNSHDLKQVAKNIPLDRLLIETDSPYLAPVPCRGKTNEPAWVAHVAASVAALRGIPVDILGQATTANFFRLFNSAKPA